MFHLKESISDKYVIETPEERGGKRLDVLHYKCANLTQNDDTEYIYYNRSSSSNSSNGRERALLWTKSIHCLHLKLS
jgi:hypothetical protein